MALDGGVKEPRQQVACLRCGTPAPPGRSREGAEAPALAQCPRQDGPEHWTCPKCVAEEPRTIHGSAPPRGLVRAHAAPEPDRFLSDGSRVSAPYGCSWGQRVVVA